MQPNPEPDAESSSPSSALHKFMSSSMDPLSVTASVAGLISLGLTVSGGVIQYCKAYRSQDADLARLVQHAEELELFLNVIDNRTSGSQYLSSDVDSLLQRCQDSCNICLLDFKQLNAKYAYSNRSKDLKERSRRLVQHLRYPFDKRKLDDLRSQLQEFNVKLIGHLQLLNLDLTQNLRSMAISESTKLTQAVKSIGTQLESSISATEYAVTGIIHNGIDKLESTIQRSVKETEENIKAWLSDNLGPMASGVSLLGESQNSQALLLRNHLDQPTRVQLISQTNAPAAWVNNRTNTERNNAIDSHQIQAISKNASSQAAVPNIFDSLCRCSRTQRMTSNLRHQQGCIYSFGNRRKWTYTTKFRAFSRQITQTWEVEYSQLAWWRDWQIHRNITLRATVDSYAPAFEAMYRLGRNLPPGGVTIQYLQEMFRNCLIELQQIFTSGNGWPTDATSTGTNLLHLAGHEVLCTIQTSEHMIILIQFLSALVEMGVPINEENILFQTPLARVINFARFRQNSSDIIPPLINKFLNMEASFQYWSDTITVPVLHLKIGDLYEPFSTSELCRAVIHRNKHDTLRLIQSGCSVLNERNARGHTLLHLAAHWPEGLAILIETAGEAIQSIINDPVNYYFGATPLEYAIKLGEADSVRLLLNAGARVTIVMLYLSEHALCTAQIESIVHLLAESLARQRRDLLQLALLYLPTNKIDELGLQEGMILDHRAFDVAEALRKQGVSLPVAHDKTEVGSVYHTDRLTLLVVEKLYDAGFRETNSMFRGYHRLMCNFWAINLDEQLELVSWFECRGANIHAPIPIPDKHFNASYVGEPGPVYPTIFKIMSGLGVKPPKLLLGDNLRQFTRLLEDEISDPCRCYCTNNDLGCTPASKYMCGGLYSLFSSYRRAQSLEKRSGFLFNILSLVESAISECNGCRVVLDIIRFITFDILDMTHTCCGYLNLLDPVRYKSDMLILMDPEECEEIREEEQHLAARLETLMEEFEMKFHELNLPLSQFVESYWFPRIKQVVEEKDELTAEHLHAIREVGVLLYDP